MNQTPLHLHEITGLQDEHLLAWFDLYETCFPPEERPLVSVYLRHLQHKAVGQPVNTRLFAALDETGEVAGMAQLRAFPAWRVEYLGYMAIDTTRRSQGSGSMLYRLMVDLVRQEGARWLAFDVEMPERMTSEATRQQAERRLRFYARLGVQPFTGARFKWGSIEQYLMVHPLAPVGEEELMTFFRQMAAEFGGELVLVGGAEAPAQLC